MRCLVDESWQPVCPIEPITPRQIFEILECVTLARAGVCRVRARASEQP